MIAPPSLLAGTRRLASLHRARGHAVAVADAHAIYDAFGFGARSAEAIRAFLDDALSRAPGLRHVLLVGDAGWLATDDTVPYPLAERGRRNQLPTWTVLSEVGPAASDHLYAATPDDPSAPRFALGRLPVADAETLDRLVDKIAAYLAETPAEPSVALMVSDRSRVSASRSRRVQRQLEGSGLRLVGVAEDGVQPLDEALIEALDRHPGVVHFSGHGSRHAWQLGATHTLGEDAFFSRDEVARLAPSPRPALVVSVSCATAPFDHPSADSLAEVMLLAEGRGATAFVGASARLYTPPRFGEVVLEALDRGATIGEALAEAKRVLATPRIALLYSLLGDPALPLR